MQIILKNIQAIKEYVFDLPDAGVVRIAGNNSNGKSTLMRLIQVLCSGGLAKDKERLPLINDNAEFGSFAISARGKTLMGILHRNKLKTFVRLVRPDGTIIDRYLRDGGIDKLVEEFGFRVFEGGHICIQLYESFGAMPFVNLTDKQNAEIAKSVVGDTTAEKFLENYKITYNLASSAVRELNGNIDNLRTQRSALRIDDVAEKKVLLKQIKEQYAASAFMLPVEEVQVPPPPVKISFMRESQPLEEIPIVKFITYTEEIPSLQDIILKMRQIKKGKCPTCGRLLLGGENHSHVI